MFQFNLHSSAVDIISVNTITALKYCIDSEVYGTYTNHTVTIRTTFTLALVHREQITRPVEL